MNLTETDFLLTITTFIILIVILMMVLVYGIFIKKKSELLLSQQKKEALFEQELAISQVEIKEQTLDYYYVHHSNSYFNDGVSLRHLH